MCIAQIGPLKQPASLSLFVDHFTIQQVHLQATLFDPFPSPFHRIPHFYQPQRIHTIQREDHRRPTPSADISLVVERGTVRVKSLAQNHNAMALASA